MSALREALRRAESSGLTLAPAEPAPATRAPQSATPEATEPVRRAPPEERKSPWEASRLPFHLTLSVLAALAVGVAIYFWMQLRPAPQVARGASPPPPAQARPAPHTIDPEPPIPGLPPLDPSRDSGVNAPSRAATQTVATNAPEAKPAAAPPRGDDAALTLELTAPRRTEFRIHPRVELGYAAWKAGSLDDARKAYVDALQDEPLNRDARLGLAAVEQRANRLTEAARHLQALLSERPDDALAQAALIVLSAERTDPLSAESRIKLLLAVEPDLPALHFALGNQYARQSRWAEAERAYRQALHGDSSNPDIAFNLAVSLDRLQHSEAARLHYERALALAAGRPHAFDAGAASRRVLDLLP